MLKCKPSFCYITPIALLEPYARYSKTHLVLAHLVDKSSEYADFYKQCRAAGDYIMMDNGAYELLGSYDPDKLLSLAERCGANAIVLPDYPFQHSKVTIQAAEKFAPIFKDAGYDNFFVPQSKVGDLEDWIWAYEWAAHNELIDILGISILGVPNALPNVDPTYARVVMMQLLLDRELFADDKHHHFLGLNSGPRTEIPSLIRMGVLNTVDSSNPVWTAVLGHQYCDNTDSLLTVKKPKMPVDFFMHYPKDQATLDRIAHNCEMTNKLFVDQTQEVWYAVE